MAGQLRWILAGLSLLLLAGIWWWGARRSRQSPGNAELREAASGAARAPGSAGDDAADLPPMPRVHETSREWGVPPLDPLSIRTADFEPAPFDDRPMTAHADPLESTFDLGMTARDAAVRKFVRVPTLRMNDAVPVAAVDVPPPAVADAVAPAAADTPLNSAPVPTAPPAAPAAPQPHTVPAPPEPALQEGPNAAESQRIVGVRVCAPGDVRWAGSDLLAALDRQGLTHGRYQVFHRRHVDGRTLFCAASLVEPGTFDLARMPEEEYRGLTLFAVLPGPDDPVQTVEAMIVTAAALAQTLEGVLQDSKGAPLSQQRAEALRAEAAHFQSQLAMH